MAEPGFKCKQSGSNVCALLNQWTLLSLPVGLLFWAEVVSLGNPAHPSRWVEKIQSCFGHYAYMYISPTGLGKWTPWVLWAQLVFPDRAWDLVKYTVHMTVNENFSVSIHVACVFWLCNILRLAENMSIRAILIRLTAGNQSLQITWELWGSLRLLSRHN